MDCPKCRSGKMVFKREVLNMFNESKELGKCDALDCGFIGFMN